MTSSIHALFTTGRNIKSFWHYQEFTHHIFSNQTDNCHWRQQRRKCE